MKSVGDVGRMRRIGFLLGLVLLSAFVSRANEAGNLARIHVEAIGGKHRLGLLQSLKVKGHVNIDERWLNFTLWAQRPNRVRIETRASDHVLVQATDGVNPPWAMNPEAAKLKPSRMVGDEARGFSNDAEFDDPLVDYEARGFTLDYAGEIEWEGRKTHRILVTRNYVDGYYLMLDAETYFITGKQSVRKTELGREASIETVYSDFRPVAGIIMPHRFVVKADGRTLHETVLQKVEPNASIPAGSFTMPVVKTDP